MGATPDTLDPDAVAPMLEKLALEKKLNPDGLPPLDFDPETDVIFFSMMEMAKAVQAA